MLCTNCSNLPGVTMLWFSTNHAASTLIPVAYAKSIIAENTTLFQGFAAQHAEAIFVGGHSPGVIAKNIGEVRDLAEQFGRKRDDVKFLAMICPIIGKTEEEARAKYDDYNQYGDVDGALALFGGWTGVDLSKYSDDENFLVTDSPRIQSMIRRWAATVPGTENQPWTKKTIAEYLSVGGLQAKLIGSPTTVADEIERWVDITDVDGFNLVHITNPGCFEDIAEYLLPELRRRGLFRNNVENEGATAREVFIGSKRLPEDHPGSKYKWRAGEKAPRYTEFLLAS